MRDTTRSAAVALTVAAVLTACSPAPAARPPAVPSPAAPAPPRVPSAPELPGRPVYVAFAGERSAFALLAECDGEGDDLRCRQHIAALEDGRWRLRRSPLPDVAGGDGITAGIHALAPGQALIVAGTGREPDRTWFTADGARTWTRGTTEVTGTAEAIPPGAMLTTECLAVRSGSCGRNRLVLVMPGTGEYRALATQPGLTGLLSTAGTTRDGARWASGLDPATELPALAVTYDDGRTWQTRPVPGPGAKDTWGLRVVDAGTALYATERGQLPPEEVVKNGLRAIHRSTDKGRTWERVWSYRSGRNPLSILADPIATADGTLTINAELGVYRSTDGGRTFQGPLGGVPSGTATWTPPVGYLWSDGQGQGTYKISLDGLNWHEFTLGGRG
ncbi:WD40/YVTN/BNR-like repeat-containing protein [Sphaerisporangium aureirubrum]|uniref:WD40/YVTN/BNR-like repeat-containing protein n=1 Tax=Sphaerisporangium aureirubrum TaxID=1544736 RepID=A0ABW1ND38_9ACTN